MISHSDVYKFDGNVHLQDPNGALRDKDTQTFSGRDAITTVQMHPHSPCLEQLSRVMILIVTVELEGINRALPVSPLPSAQAKAWNFPADFLQKTWEPPPHTHSW